MIENEVVAAVQGMSLDSENNSEDVMRALPLPDAIAALRALNPSDIEVVDALIVVVPSLLAHMRCPHRCTQCDGDHHWLFNGYVMVCKHCEAVREVRDGDE